MVDVNYPDRGHGNCRQPRVPSPRTSCTNVSIGLANRAVVQREQQVSKSDEAGCKTNPREIGYVTLLILLAPCGQQKGLQHWQLSLAHR